MAERDFMAKSGHCVHVQTILQRLYKSACCKKKEILEDSEAKWKRVLWPDETKIEHFGLQAKRYDWWKVNTAHHSKNTMPTEQ